MVVAFFALFAVMAIFGALMMVLQKSPVASALFLILTFASLAGLFVLLHAPFLAAVQVVVYAGAIMVLFLFVIMLLNLRNDIDDGVHHAARRLFGWLLGLVLAALIYLFFQRSWSLGPAGDVTPETMAEVGNTQMLGLKLFTEYLLPFELTSLVLLAAIVGAVVLALRKGEEKGVEGAP
jgi:NADH-quinone oxidoreductase subunit J